MIFKNVKVSIIITNYNYEEYVEEAILSALRQTYTNIEVIVVDDGSTDNSQKTIKKYSDRIITVFQENKGMIEASNTGFAKSSGELIMFLDADDYLEPFAINKVVDAWDEKYAKIHFRLSLVDNNKNIIGYKPDKKKNLSTGDVYKEILSTGKYYTVPTSGNVYSKNVLANFFPIQDYNFSNINDYLGKFSTDGYLKRKVPFHGNVGAIQKPLGFYRIHGKNFGATKSEINNKIKRNRYLELAKNDLIYIKHYKGDNYIIDDDFIFRDGNMMVLRIISNKMDENNSWDKKNSFRLLFYYWKTNYHGNLLRVLKHSLRIVYYIFAPKILLN